MKVIKESLDNLEKVQDRKTTQGIVMKNAEQESNEAEKNFKEIAGDPQELKTKKPFLGAEKQETPKEVETPKPQLEESLFMESNSGDLRGALEDLLLQTIQNAVTVNEVADALHRRGFDYDYEWCCEDGSEPQVRKLEQIESQYVDALVDTFLAHKPVNESIEDSIGDLDKNDTGFLYQLLDRMRQDCNYVIAGGTRGGLRHLWSSGNPAKHIANMTDLYNYLVKLNGPIDWITKEDIEEYGRKLNEIENNDTPVLEGKMKNGIMLDTTGEPLTFWDKIYAELDGNLSPDDNDYKMLVELPSTKAIRYQNINTDYDGNIEVVAPTEDALQHAINVADYYDLEYKTGVSNGNNAENAFYCKLIIPQYLQDKNVTYDSRKQKYKDKKEN